jgi:deazaflavin-dependent oxidoreductase (nitroreductase family)
MHTAMRRVLWALLAATVALAVLQGIIVAVFRTRWRPGIDAIRRFNRRWLNPRMALRAGTEGWYAASIHHVGRRTGRQFATPVLAERVGNDQFLIPLPYGADVDWCRNVLAAGAADLDADGTHYHVVAPRLVGADEAAPSLPPRLRNRLTLYGVDRYLRLDAA